MNGVKRKTNENPEKRKKVKEIEINDENIETIFFESELKFDSTVRRMQVDALLHEVTLTEKKRVEIDRFIEEIAEEMKSIPAGKIRPLSSLPEWLEKFGIKIPLEFSKLKKNFQFFPPKNIEKIGSFVDESLLVKSSILVDVLVEIPRESLEKKVFLNNRYVEKRAIYLCFLAKKLRQNSSRFLEFSHLNETTRNQPVLLVKPNETENFSIRIILTAEENLFRENRFLPQSSNLRPKWFDEKQSEEKILPTPHYNAMILFDSRLKSNARFLKQIFSSSIQLCNGLKLLKIWLEQRNLSKGFGPFSGAMAAFFLAFLLKTNKINRQMQDHQIFRIALLVLTQEDFSPQKIASLNEQNPDQWKEKNPFFDEQCLLLDPSGFLNVFHNLSRENFQRLKLQAKLSLAIFNDPVVDHFQHLFMTKQRENSTFDAIIQISQVDRYEKFLDRKENKEEVLLDHLNDKYSLICREIVELLNEGLKQRVELICPLASTDESERTWNINKPVPKRSTLRLAVIFSDQYDSDILKGPENGSEEAKEFRRIWAKRCEVRRFADGSVLECVLWNGETVREKRFIWMDAVRFLLETHGGISSDEIEFLVQDKTASSLLSIPARLFPSYGTGDEQQVHLNQQFVELSKQIRSLNNELTTKISSIVGIDETFRYTNVFPPLPSSFVTEVAKIRSIEQESRALIPRSTSRYAPPFSQSLEILCQLDVNSSTEPGFENFQRIQHSKVLFYISLAKLLTEKFRYVCRPSKDCCYIEKSNYVYRLTATYHREIFLLESQAGLKNGLFRTMQQTDISRNLRLKTIFLPKIGAAIYGVSQQFKLYSIVTRLFKRWLSSQMLLDHFGSINADLLCCYVFLHPASTQPTKSVFAGFLRVLRLLTEFDWLHSPLIINFNEIYSADDIFQIQKEFQSNRSNLPAMCLVPSVVSYENEQPSVPVLKRLIHLAKEALEYFEKNNSDSLKFIFKTGLQIYDAIIVLDPLQCPRAYQSVDHLTNEVTYTTRKRLTDIELEQQNSINVNKRLIPIVDYDPARCFLDELRNSFDQHAEFFHDQFGGLFISVLWKPNTRNNKKIDYVQIIEQWKTLATGLIKEIRTFPERWQ